MLLIFIDAGALKFEVKSSWVDLLQLVLITVIGAYFGGSGLGILNGGVNLGLGKTHFASNEDTQTLDTDWGADTTASDNDSDLIVLDGSGTEFPAGTTIYGMYDYVELHSGSVICYVAPRHDYPGSRAAAI